MTDPYETFQGSISRGLKAYEDSMRPVWVGHPLRLFGTTDRWGRDTRYLEAPACGRLSPVVWAKVDAFQSYEPSPAVIEMAKKKFMQPMVDEVSAVVSTNPGFSAVWQLHLEMSNGQYVTASTLFMAHPRDRLVRYGWLRRFVLRPALVAAAWAYNKTVARWFPIKYDRE